MLNMPELKAKNRSFILLFRSLLVNVYGFMYACLDCLAQNSDLFNFFNSFRWIKVLTNLDKRTAYFGLNSYASSHKSLDIFVIIVAKVRKYFTYIIFIIVYYQNRCLHGHIL